MTTLRANYVRDLRATAEALESDLLDDQQMRDNFAATLRLTADRLDGLISREDGDRRADQLRAEARARLDQLRGDNRVLATARGDDT